jgi:hypothetical protein
MELTLAKPPFGIKYRFATQPPPSGKSPSLPTDIRDGLHYQVVDTIVGPLFRKAISYFEITPGGHWRSDTLGPCQFQIWRIASIKGNIFYNCGNIAVI